MWIHGYFHWYGSLQSALSTVHSWLTMCEIISVEYRKEISRGDLQRQHLCSSNAATIAYWQGMTSGYHLKWAEL